MQKIFDPSSSSYIEKRTEDGVSVISTSMTSNDKDAAFQKQYDYFSSDDDMSESSKERKINIGTLKFEKLNYLYYEERSNVATVTL